jgi:cytochrome P450
VPALVQTMALLVNPYVLLDCCRRLYGRTFVGRITGNRVFVIIGDAPLVRDVFAGCGVPRDALDVGNDEFRPLVGENSLVVMNGPRHARHRRVLVPPFTAGAMAAFGPIAMESAEAEGARWTPGDVVPVTSLVRRIGIRVIVSVVFGPLDEARRRAIEAALEHLISVAIGPMLYVRFLQRDFGRWSPGGRVWAARRRLMAVIDAEIAACRADGGQGSPKSIVQALVSARDEDGAPLSADEIREEVLTILIAGHDPTATAAAWLLSCLHEHPSAADDLHDEVQSAGLDPQAISRLPGLDAACQESLRLYPPIPIVERVARVPVQLGPYEIPAGLRIAPCSYLVHRDPDLFPNPDAFRPERFRERRFAPHEFLPFGGGTRRCIGSTFAPFQMKLTVASLLRRFRMRLDSTRAKAVFRGGTVAPSDSFKLRVVEVLAPSEGRVHACSA